ncbi:uncharacterized protein LOC119310280 [Triticum dicoccoides]|uniref:uncharacterized protein LOC119310280 n=1 Tax=Triticum dicoccoides TaxID=85692 RepID=UPI00188E2BFF|nr:uncharacterized protein LOC119310280 [Triticum dicoccoides]
MGRIGCWKAAAITLGMVSPAAAGSRMTPVIPLWRTLPMGHSQKVRPRRSPGRSVWLRLCRQILRGSEVSFKTEKGAQISNDVGFRLREIQLSGVGQVCWLRRVKWKMMLYFAVTRKKNFTHLERNFTCWLYFLGM